MSSVSIGLVMNMFFIHSFFLLPYICTKYYFTLLTKPIKPFEQKQFQSIVYNRNSISINVHLNYSVSTRNTGKISIFPTQKTTRYSFRQAMNLNLFRGFLFSLSPTYSQTVFDLIKKSSKLT
jgi:hypothetical protein